MADNSKLISSGDLSSKIKGGGSGGNNSGPTGSQRTYPNTGPTNSPKLPDASKFNPMNCGKSTFGVGGV